LANQPVGYENGVWKPESGLNADELKQHRATKKEIQDKMSPTNSPKYKEYQKVFKAMIDTIESQGGVIWNGIVVGTPPPKNHPFYDEYFELLKIFEGGKLRPGDASKSPSLSGS